MTPVYFGSALRKFGVRELIDALAELAPPPQPEKAVKAGQDVDILPTDKTVAGFVFKVQANMDLNHRDRVAFLRLCSGEFKRGMKLKTAENKTISVHNPILFFAQDRELAENAYAGDVILESLAEEGVTQLFKPSLGADMIVGAVGSLQIDVMRERIKTEYGLDVTFEINIWPNFCLYSRKFANPKAVKHVK